MKLIDIIILIPFVFAIYKGITRGFISQVAGIAGVILGFILGVRFSDLLSTHISEWINANESTIKIISFAIIIICVLILAKLLSSIIERIFSFIMLGWLNKILGILIAIASTALVMGAVITLISYVNEYLFTIVPQRVINESILYRPLQDLAQMVFPYLGEFLKSSQIL